MNKKVLLVEDDSFLRDICFSKMQKLGLDVDYAVDGLDALRKINDGKPSVVLLDVVMPSLDGFEVLQKVRASEDPEIVKTTIIMLSNLGQDTSIERARKMGADDYMIKAHVTPDEIVDKVREYLDRV